MSAAHILWVSDSADTPSGFGNVTGQICSGLARRGYQVSILGWQTRELGEWQGCRLYPTQTEKLGGDALYPLLVKLRPDVVISLADVWWLPYFGAPHVQRQLELTGTPWLLYFPIDGDIGHDRLPQSWIDMLHAVDVPVAMSHYGKRVAASCGIASEYIPHGVDLQTFCPPPDRAAIKAKLGYTGKFVVLSDSRNQPRKMLPRLLDSFAKFAQNRDDALLHLHTDAKDEFTRSSVNSYSITEDIVHLGLQHKVRFTPGFEMKKGAGLSFADLALFYQAADVHLLASSGEGFGLPTLQAAAAGAVPLACAYSASQELTADHGISLPVADWTANEFGIRRALIDVDATAAALTELYLDRQQLADRSRRSRQFALAYGWEIVIDQWDRLLRSVAASHLRGRRALKERTQSVHQIAPGLARHGTGISVSMKVVDREYGRLESSILADARGRYSDVRIPASPPPCEVATLRVPRRPGFVGIAALDHAIFLRLRAIFPIVHGYVFQPGDPALSADPRTLRPIASIAESDYALAQSVLLLDSHGELPERLLIQAALYGVPCIGPASSVVQQQLWPDLVTSDREAALTIARDLLTNAARMRRASETARARCASLFHTDHQASAQALRRQHAEQTRVLTGREP